MLRAEGGDTLQYITSIHDSLLTSFQSNIDHFH